MTMEKFNLFSSWVTGQGIEISDKTNSYQCFDLAYAYIFFLNIPKSTIQHLYAYEIFTKPTDTTNTFFERIENSDIFIPKQGDIGIFDTKVGIAGHVCVCTGEGDTKTFKSLDQNWNGKSIVTLVTHNYTGFLGVLRPKYQGTNDQTLLPILDAKGNKMEVQKVRSILLDQEQQIVNLLTEKDSLTFTLTSLNARISELEAIMATPTSSPIETPKLNIFQSFIEWLNKLGL
jgi:hypothetical protein